MSLLSLLLLGMCGCVVSVVMWSSLVCMGGCLGTLYRCGGCCDCDACTVVCVACVYAESVRGCDGDGNAGVRAGGGVAAVNAWCACMGGTRGSCFVSTSDDVLDMGVVHGVRGVCGVCEMCMVWGGVGVVEGEWVRGYGLGFTNPVGTGCLCCVGVGGVMVRVGGWRGQGFGGWVVWCYVCVCCESGFFVEMAGPGICVFYSADTCTS